MDRLERRNADTRNTREPMQVLDVPGFDIVRYPETGQIGVTNPAMVQPLIRLGTSRCGQAPKGVGGMPRRHQKSERGRLRNAWGSCRTSVDPGILTKTQGTETSQYLVE